MKRTKSLPIKEQARFVKEIVAYLESIGAEFIEQYTLSGYSVAHYRYKLQTKFGELQLTVATNSNSVAGPGTVFTCFAEPNRAMLATACNPYSGKWNHHYFDGTADYAVQDFQAQMRKVLLYLRYEGTVEVCCHTVKYHYEVVPVLLDEGEISPNMQAILDAEAEDRAKSQIIEGYHSGELNCLWEGEHEIRGWWEIV